MPESHEDEIDPRIEQALRLGELRKEVMDRIDGPSIECGTENMPMDIQESFWQHILAFEAAEDTTIAARLEEEAGFAPRDPGAIEDADDLHKALWELLHALASIRIYVHFTDHLDDADLYRLLVKGALPGETVALPKDCAINTRIDAAEYGTAEDPDGTSTWLRYYADEKSREMWDGPVPTRERPPYDRDRKLPVPPEESEHS